MSLLIKYFELLDFPLSIAAGVYRLSHKEKALILGAKHDLGSRTGIYRNGNCVRSESSDKIQLKEAEQLQPVPVLQVTDSKGLDNQRS